MLHTAWVNSLRCCSAVGCLSGLPALSAALLWCQKSPWRLPPRQAAHVPQTGRLGRLSCSASCPGQPQPAHELLSRLPMLLAHPAASLRSLQGSGRHGRQAKPAVAVAAAAVHPALAASGPCVMARTPHAAPAAARQNSLAPTLTSCRRRQSTGDFCVTVSQVCLLCET